MSAADEVRASLTALPLEVLEQVLDFCPLRTILTLRETCSTLRLSVGLCQRTWKRVCCRDMDLQGWRKEKANDEEEEEEQWIDVFLSYARFRRKIRGSDPARGGLDITRSFQGASYSNGREEVVRLPSLQINSRAVGSSLLPLRYPAEVRKVIREERGRFDELTRCRTLSYAFNDDYFVVSHSVEDSRCSTLSAWRTQGSTIVPMSTSSSKAQVDFEIPYQHGHVWRRFFLCIPLASRRHAASIVNLYDIEDDFSLALAVDNPTGFRLLRECPSVYKEGGAGRIYSHGDRIVLVDGTPMWKVHVFRAREEPDLQLDVLQCVHLPTVMAHIVSPFFCSTQSGPRIGLAFFTKHPNSSSLAKSIIATFDLESMTTTKTKTASADIIVFDPAVKFDARFGTFFSVTKPVSQVQSYLIAATDLTYTSESSSSGEGGSSVSCPVLVALTAKARIFVLAAECRTRDNPMLLQQRRKRRYYGDRDWMLNELVVHGSDTIAILQRFSTGRVAYALDLHTLDLLWSLELDDATNNPIPTLNLVHRLYLYCGLDLVWLSDGDGCTVFLDRRTGRPQGRLELQRSDGEEGEGEDRRPFRYRYSMRDYDSDTSPYAQSGFGVWEVRVSGGRRRRITLVHDMERCAPVAFDCVELDGRDS